jgi:methylenetetrahydrofolate dehydrogenase (NADP+)/methenyltetrahydrofolate cyclohydrolase
MIVLDGSALQKEKAEVLKERISKLNEKPHLTIIQVGSLPASISYIKRKIVFAEEIGATASVVNFTNDATTDEIHKTILNLNTDGSVHGIIVQLPLPDNIDQGRVINSIDINKDVDGITGENLWKLVNRENSIVPATTKGIYTLLSENDIDVVGKIVVMVGDSLLVGRPTAMYFLNKGATVTVCHDKTKNLEEFTNKADILIVAVGKANLIGKGHVKDGQVVIDVGINKTDDGKLVGDVNFEEVKDLVSAISPVPGGVGPMTVSSLFENLVDIVEKH